MRKRKLSKLLYLMVVMSLLLSILPISVFAATTGTVTPPATGADTANSMTNSMVTFFRDDRTSLQSSRVAREEALVYGVFLSNFFVPFNTKLNDMIDDSSDKSIPKTLSTKFFGSAGKSGQIVELNKILHTAITDILGDTAGTKKNFALYPTVQAAKEGKVLTGEDFYNKLGGKFITGGNKDLFLYNTGGNPVMDLGDKGTHAAFQILFGIAPEMMLDSKNGLRKFTGLYMDGLGNIWGAPDGASVGQYVLFMPAALNPIVFSKSYSNTKLPLTNVFAMGQVLKMSENFLSTSNSKVLPMTPYYNINEYVNGNFNSNVATIFGIQTPTSMIGQSNSILEKGVGSNPYNAVKDFVNMNSSQTIPVSGASVVVSVDADKVTGLNGFLTSGTSLDQKQKGNLIDYLFHTTVFNLTELADDMYYFKIQNGASGGEGAWGKDNDADLLLKQKLFAKETSPSSGEYTFYSKSYFPSPFNIFQLEYMQSPDKDVNLKTKLGLSDSDITTTWYKALRAFLDTGSFGGASVGDISKAFSVLSKSPNSNALVYGITPPSTVSKLVVDKSWFNLIDNKWYNTSFGMGDGDWYSTSMSMAARKQEGIFAAQYNVPDFPPFISTNGGGGHINGNSEKDVNAIATYFHNFMTYRIFSMNSTFVSQLTTATDKGFALDSGTAGKGTTKSAIMNDINNYPGIYWGYMVSLLNIHQTTDASGKKSWAPIGKFDSPVLPYMVINTMSGGLDLNNILGASGVVASQAKTLEEMQKDIIFKVYGLLSDGPNNYRDKLIKSTQDSWIIDTHRSITGSWVGNVLSVSAGGSNSYASVVGYINTPSLTDLPLTSWVLKDYMFVYMFFMLLVIIILILMVLSNIRTLREGALIFVLMAFVLILPQFLVSNVINISNTAGDKMYSSRFNYWAITQHQQSLSNLKSAQKSSNELDYTIALNMDAAKQAYSSDVGVRVKWMSPKKDDVFDKLFNQNQTSQSLTANLTIFRWLFNSFMNQEEYVYNDPLATYLYRPYNSIASEAKTSYESLKDSVVTRQTVAAKVKDAKDANAALGIPDYRFNLLLTPDASKVKYSDDQKKLVDSASTLDVTTQADHDKMESYRYWLLNNPAVSKAVFRNDYQNNAGLQGDPSNPYYNDFTLTTESPFYYFYNALRSRYDGVDGGFKSALLTKKVFMTESDNPKVNNKLRDFLDLQGLFTYVIPYLQQSNEYVYGWTKLNGKSIEGYTGVAPSDAALNAQYTQQQNKKNQLKDVWKMYSPWVDQMYSLDVLSKKVYVANQKQTVDDTMNPGAYDSLGRPMIFSPSDMFAKNYQYSDLSSVEQRMQATLNSTYKDMLYLTNYYDFDNEVLVTAAAMMATFNFDREFSQNKFLGQSNLIYPQNFELKNFNYDAFMRLMLLNATGEPLMADKDLYVRILDKTSIFTGILLLVKDLTAVIVVPTAKVIVLLLLLFLSILVSISCVLTPPEKISKMVMKNLGLPSALFLVSSIAFAFIVSLFMGEGLTGYVGGRTPTVGISDPTTTMGLMVVVDCTYIFVLWKIIKMLLGSFKTHMTSSFFTTVALASGLVTSTVSGALSKAKDAVGSAVGYGMKRRDYNRMLDAVQDRNSGGGSDGGSSSGTNGYSARTGSGHIGGTGTSGGGRSSDSNSNNQHATSDKDNTFKDDVEGLASKRGDGGGDGASKSSSLESDNSIKKRSIGHKVIDFKYDMRNKLDDAKDGVVSAGRKVKDSAVSAGRAVKESATSAGRAVSDSARYVSSKDGLAKDVTDKASSARTKGANYVKDVQDYSAYKHAEYSQNRTTKQRQNASRGKEALSDLKKKASN